MHVTEHKVECFECHDEIHHGLLPIAEVAPAPQEGCGACHESSHDAARQMFAGTGAVGVEDAPSRMYSTRVVCDACHTGRSGFQVIAHTGSAAGSAAALDLGGADSHGRSHSRLGGTSTVAAAGNVDCIHCHGPRFDGMLAEWQGTVEEQLQRLARMLDDVRSKVAADRPATVVDALQESAQVARAADGRNGDRQRPVGHS